MSNLRHPPTIEEVQDIVGESCRLFEMPTNGYGEPKLVAEPLEFGKPYLLDLRNTITSADLVAFLPPRGAFRRRAEMVKIGSCRASPMSSKTWYVASIRSIRHIYVLSGERFGRDGLLDLPTRGLGMDRRSAGWYRKHYAQALWDTLIEAFQRDEKSFGPPRVGAWPCRLIRLPEAKPWNWKQVVPGALLSLAVLLFGVFVSWLLSGAL